MYVLYIGLGDKGSIHTSTISLPFASVSPRRAHQNLSQILAIYFTIALVDIASLSSYFRRHFSSKETNCLYCKEGLGSLMLSSFLAHRAKFYVRVSVG